MRNFPTNEIKSTSIEENEKRNNRDANNRKDENNRKELGLKLRQISNQILFSFVCGAIVAIICTFLK